MGTFTRIQPPEALKLIQDGATVLDIRDEPSFDKGHIKGASHSDRQRLFDVAEEGNPEDTYLIYCYRGQSSQMAAQMLADEGFEHVFSLDGGFEGWASAYPNEIE